MAESAMEKAMRAEADTIRKLRAELESERTARREAEAARNAYAEHLEAKQRKIDEAEVARRRAEEERDMAVQTSHRIRQEQTRDHNRVTLLIAAVEEHEREKRKAHIWRDLEDMARWHQETDSRLWRSISGDSE